MKSPPKKHRSPLAKNRLLFRKSWKYISGESVGYSQKLAEIRSNALSYQLNYVLLITLSILLAVTVYSVNYMDHEKISWGTYRIMLTLILSLCNIILARLKFHKASKLSLIFLTPVMFLLSPLFFHYVEAENYTYNSILIIAGSIIPQLLLSSEKEKFLYWASMVYYFILLMFIEVLMFNLQSETNEIAEEIRKFYFFFKVSHIGGFLFVNICIYHLRKVNFRFEERVNEKNMILNYQNRELKDKGEKILHQKEIIEKNSHYIMESIHYASRIQNAVLQPVNFLDKMKLDNFILYKPAAVVSGDFYWGSKKDDKVIVALADCTGHGVPGAFMSMLGLAFLDDILDNEGALTAAEVLNALRESVISKLRQKGEEGETRDGMDMSLCILDINTGILNFAGANNSAYIIRDNSLSVLEADKMPVGFHSTKMNPFTDKIMELTKGDLVYLFSDGYADQFGGDRRKRFMSRQLRDLLLRIHNEPMDAQRYHLDETFERWKGTEEQIDDVTIVGLRL